MGEMHEVIDAVVDAGKLMLENGSEIYRSEETMVRLANSFGIKNIDIFTLATCIYVTCRIDGDTYTRIRRTYPKSTDLSIISKVNQLSRRMAESPLSVEDFNKQLKEIEQSKKPKKIVVASTMAITSAVFAFMLQKCSINDFLCTAVIGFIAYYLLESLNGLKVHLLFKNFFVTIFIAIAALVCIEMDIGHQVDDIIIGSIMLLVPGVATTNAVRDTLMGDILSGMIRVLEAVIAAIGIAAAVGLVLGVYRLMTGVGI